jgi:TolB protein
MRMNARTVFPLVAYILLATAAGCGSGTPAAEQVILFAGCREKDAAEEQRLQIFRQTECAIYSATETGVASRRMPDGTVEQVPTYTPTALTEHGGRYSSPRWSPDGERIAFVSDGDGDPRIYVMDADGSKQLPVTSDPASDAYPAWSPDGGRIAFLRGSGSGTNIHVVNVDGTGQIQITGGPHYDVYYAHPLADFSFDPWSPGGDRLAFSRYTIEERESAGLGTPELFVVNADGTDQRRLAESGHFLGWSPDGTRLLAAGTVDGETVIKVVNADGSGQTVIPMELPGHLAPYPMAAWSPDGRRVAFVAWDEAGSVDSIYVVDGDGANLRLVTTGRCPARQGLSWSPDGKLLAHVAGCEFDSSIGIINVDGSGATTLTGPGGTLISTRAPDWSPAP